MVLKAIFSQEAGVFFVRIERSVKAMMPIPYSADLP